MSERGLELHRRRGGVRRVATWALLVGPMAMAATVLFGLAAHPDTAALGAGPRLEPLHGRQPQVPPGATLLGPAPSSTVLPLTVTLQPRDPAALAAEAEAVSDPTSADYRHFLTPQQFAQRFGPTPGTIAQVTATLKQAGLTVGSASSTGLSLAVSGTVAQVQSAFATPIDRYRLSSGKTGYHNRSAPEVPVTVAPEIQGILGLDTLSPPQPTTSVPAANASGSGAGALGVTPALAPGQPQPSGTTCTINRTASAMRSRATAPSTRRSWHRRTRSTRCTRRATTEPGPRWHWSRWRGRGSARATSRPSPTATGSRPGPGRSPRRTSSAAAPPEAAPWRPSSTSRRSFPWRPRRTSRSTRVAPRPACTRLQPDRQ